MLKEMEQPRHFVTGSSSSERRKGMKNFIDQVFEPETAFAYGFSPDSDGGIEESLAPKPAEVAWEKLLVIGAALELIPREKVEKPWVEDIQHIETDKFDVSEDDITLVTSDVVTRVDADPVKVFTTHEITRLSRQRTEIENRTDLTPQQKKRMITKLVAQDKHRMKELYHRQDFAVTFTVAIAFWRKNGERGVAEFEVFAHFNALPKSELEKIYEPNGIAWRSAPRVDLSALAGKYADLVMIRNTNDQDHPWVPLNTEILFGLVREGTLPAKQFLDLLNADMRVLPVNIEDQEFTQPTPTRISLENMQVSTLSNVREQV